MYYVIYAFLTEIPKPKMGSITIRAKLLNRKIKIKLENAAQQQAIRLKRKREKKSIKHNIIQL